MAAQRIRGQEVETLVVVAGQTVDSIAAIKSIDIDFQLDLLEEAYLGETTNRYDSIFKGVKGKAETHFSDRGVFAFTRAIIDKARRRVGGLTINIKTTFNFANGDRARVLLPNVEFGTIPFKTGSRSDYVTMSLDFACSDGQVIG